VTSPVFDLAAALATLRQAAVDLETNAPLPPRPSMTMADAAATLKSAQPFLIRLDAWVTAHPGAVTALLDILEGAEAQGFSWASDLRGIVSAVPGGLAAADSAIPKIIWAMAEFAPAPGWGDGGLGYEPGPEPFAR